MKITLEIEVPEDYSQETKEHTAKLAVKLKEYGELFASKQESYGRGNIAKFGEQGVIIRLHDKLERLVNLTFKNGSNDLESVRDTWLDALGYGAIGLMCHDGDW